jgi:outer membrane receptor protein involved in Fe transport
MDNQKAIIVSLIENLKRHVNHVKISYNQRIRRPSVRQINTNIDRSNTSSISIGNPNLKPTLTENFEIGINSFGRFLQGSFQIYHKHSKNVIESFLEVNDNGISESQYKNIGETKQTGIGFFGSINFGSKFSFRSGMNIYNYTGKDARIGYSDWTEPVLLYSYNFGGNLSFAKYWKAETFAFYRSPSQTLQGSITSFSMMSIGIKREFKNKRGSIGIRIIEPFQKNKEFRSDLSGDFFTQESIRTIPFRSLSISFRYTLGKLNFKDGSKKTNIRNDDIKEERQDY